MDFDWKFYINYYGDLKRSNIIQKNKHVDIGNILVKKRVEYVLIHVKQL